MDRPPYDDQPRFALIDEDVKTENGVASPGAASVQDLVPPSVKPSSSPAPLPSTEAPDPAPMATSAKKKGTAAAVKKAPKRPKNKDANRKPKKPRSAAAAKGADESSDGDESDNGPYCLCRGPDDHRWMICCEYCEDWFHGECINISKDIGESLIEKFVCPNCTKGNLVTIYKKTCALGSCRKPARLSQVQPSVFCSSEHAQTWWERMISRLPKTQSKQGLRSQLSQDELMAILNSDLGVVGQDGTWKITRTPFSGTASPLGDGKEAGAEMIHFLSQEEQDFLSNAADARAQLGEETVLCHKMVTLVELAQERRRAAITAGRIGEDICGYDWRLDTISARDAFAAWIKSSEGETTFEASKLGEPVDSEEPFAGMCERKRCKVHSGWYKMLPLGIKHQIREMANQSAEWAEEEAIVREAARERWKRKQAENNWVEVIEE
ncbi:hypothetical protein HIM_08039 [Hirsutella minnesotensis 3608]|uniref:PHD-type domain-containing protein n=1 Tax=Hirsutella minnesotensis 3608 TaxID=1043627 RepID=A0A0F7ZMS6_9HYPO|nr:hypothetical protein HIM_08039 [Hirsutella minnesotensis 3608]